MTSTAPKPRKFGLAVGVWGSEETLITWKYCKTHILQPKDGTQWQDSIVVVHVNTRKDKERWDVSGPLVPDVATATQAYNSNIVELEGDPPLALVEYVNKEGFDVFIIANRGRNVMKKAMMGSTTEYIIHRVSCPCLIVKPQVSTGDTYRLRSSATTAGAQAAQLATAAASAASCRSPNSSPMFARTASLATGVPTPFNRRVAIAYDTTANGRYLLKWAAENLLEPADNIFVVRAVPKRRTTTLTSFADKNGVQRLAAEALASLPHVTSFNLYQGNARKAVLAFVEKENIDLLVLGMYSEKSTRRKGLALRGNASALYNRSACPALVVPLSEVALARAVRPADLALAEEEEQELASGSESESDDQEEEGAEGAAAGHTRLSSSGDKKHRRGPLESFFKRRGSAETGGSASSPEGGGAAKGHHVSAAVAAAGLGPGSYLVQVDGAGGIKSVSSAGFAKATATPDAPSTSTAAGPSAASSAVEAELRQRLAEKEREVEQLRQELAHLRQLSGGGGGQGAAAAAFQQQGASENGRLAAEHQGVGS